MEAMSIRAQLGAFVFFLLLGLGHAAQPARLSSSEDYRTYIDPLLRVTDFGIHYYDDGAADASVLFPSTESNPYDRPREPVIALVRLRERSFPLLIDCLSDPRVTTARFDGSSITMPMKVPLGYVCLDILMEIVDGKPASDPDCADDGLGACMNEGFYFRPDDYSRCWPDVCDLRPWVMVVQRKWREAFLRRRLRFRNPYDVLRIPEYSDFVTRRK
jgi:hypothetical protein